MIHSPLRVILAATDLDEGSQEVVGGAAAVAAANGAELHVLHALDLDHPPYGTEREGPIRTFPEQTARAEAALARQIRAAVPAGISVHPAVVKGAPRGAISAHSRQISADLIVVGPHRGSGGSGRIGSTADRVIRTAEVPCLIVRGPLSPSLRRIGMAFDFSDQARGALDMAVEWAAEWRPPAQDDSWAGTELHILHVGWSVEREDDPELSRTLRDRLESEVRETMERTGATRLPGEQIEVAWAAEPAAAIAAHAQEHDLDLLVLGTHGFGPVKRFLIGSVASKVAQQAPCSVLLVPPAMARRRVAAVGPQGSLRLQRVLMAVDLARPSQEAARWTVHHFAPDAEHRFVHVIDAPEPPAFLGGPTAGTREELRSAREAAETRLRSWARSLVGSEPVEIREGNPTGEILDAIADWQPDLLVVGEHGQRGLQGWLGSTAERVLSGSDVSVLVARRVPAGTPRRILVAVDESDLAEIVLNWGRVLARGLGAPVKVVYVLNATAYAAAYTMGASAAVPGDQGAAGERDAAMRWLLERMDAAGLSGGDVAAEIVVGEPGAAIVETAIREAAELVVMGSRGAGTAGRLLLGSVSRAVLRTAECPVLIVPDAANGGGASA